MTQENFSTNDEVGIDEVLNQVEEAYKTPKEPKEEKKANTVEEQEHPIEEEDGSLTEEAEETKESEETKEDEAESDEDGETEDESDGKADKKDKKDVLIQELNDKVMRQMAEFENFRKRTEKEKTQMFDMGAKAIIEKILPIVDNFERGLASVPEDSESDSFAEGMKMIYKQMTTALEQAGLEPIEAVGTTFDPEIHNAVMHIDDEAYGENEVVEEMQKGYKYHDTVVRHSMVKVAN